MKRGRVLIIAESANPEWVSVPLEGWSHSRAVAELVPAHVVTQIRNRDAFSRAGLKEGEDFTTIDSEAVDRRAWKVSRALRGEGGAGWTTNTAVFGLTYYYFEHLVWRRFGARIAAGEFDLVHRMTPLTPTAPSLMAARCARAGVPFVWGPINGGVPWPKGFDAARRREREWLSYVRNAYRLLPGYRSTRKHAAAIIVGSRDTFRQMPARYHDRCVYIPENGVDPARFTRQVEGPVGRPLRVAFVGRLVPYKGADMLIEAAAPLVREGAVALDIIGDGPEMPKLRSLVESEGISGSVALDGWQPHEKLQERLVRADVFGFPSIREFGGAVVLEAMALGLVPVVVDYGGPAELVTEATGFKTPIGTRKEIVAGFRTILAELAGRPDGIRPMGRRARARVFQHFTWGAKARQTLEVYRWVLKERAEKPDFGCPLPDGAAAEGR